MVYRAPHPAPRSLVDEERQGRLLGRFCLVCGSVYPIHRAAHRGKPLLGKDHVASSCTYEGQPFSSSASWWEPAVEVLPRPAT